MEITILNRQRTRRVSSPALSAFLRRMARAEPAEPGSSLVVCLVSDRKMRELNRRYRGHDRPTDVLSFPSGEEPAPEGEQHLGDVVISVPTAARQASAAGSSLEREIKTLALHGYLHLLGYDHETDDGAMMRRQRRLVRRLLPRRPRTRVS